MPRLQMPRLRLKERCDEHEEEDRHSRRVGYTGADAVRLLARHPNAEISALAANTHAGKAMDEVFPHFFMLELPRLVEWEKVDWTKLDAVFCGLPHGTTQEITAAVMAANPTIKILDMSADFRLRDMNVYAQWYGASIARRSFQGEAVYGLTEFYREQITAARLVACPGCYPTAALLALVPIVKAKLIDVDDIVIDAKSGVHGSGRGSEAEHAFQRSRRGLSALFGEHTPALAGDRAGDRRRRRLSRDRHFTPHLIPMSRGRTLHVLRQAQRASPERPACRAGASLPRRVRSCMSSRRACSANAERAWFELCADRRIRRSHQEPGYRYFGAG